MVIRSARGPFDCFHFSNLTLEVVVYHKLYHISRHARPSTQPARARGLAAFSVARQDARGASVQTSRSSEYR